MSDPIHYSIIYTAEYRYDADVTDQHNALRVRPTQDERQRLDGFDLAIEPAARTYEHTDYFGTEVVQFAISERHDHLSMRAESRVRVDEPAPTPDPGWERLAERDYREAGAEFLGPLEPPAKSERIERLAADVRSETPLATLRAACSLIPDRFGYQQGVTYVGSTVDDLLAGGAGVCQDFVHLALTLLRRHGIASRYVSGYLFAPNGNGAYPQDSAEVNTHAWVEALLPDGDGTMAWIAADPTNRKLAGTDHVKIGHGRAYSDVPPIRGVYRGSPRSALDVRVKMTKLRQASAPGR